MPFPEAFLQELEEKNPIEDVVGQYVSLTRRGSNLFGLCPFHNEKTPSFSVAPEKGIFYCFGCHKGGGAVNFIMEIEGLDYPDAIRFLAKRAGMEVPEDDPRRVSSLRRKEHLWKLCRDAARFYHNTLKSPQGREGLQYLLSRGLTKKTIVSFGLGFAPNQWDGLKKAMLEKGYTIEDLQDAGLVRTKHRQKTDENGNTVDSVSTYDWFRNRVMFPIIDVRGNVIGFGGRVMDGSEPKYLNSPESMIFNKRKNLFALNVAKKTKMEMLVLTEGYMDTISMHQYGFDCAVASLGTSLTQEQAGMLSKYTKQMVLCYDGDQAGQNAAKRAIGILEKTGITVKVLRMQGAKDPDEFLKKYGAERFKKLLGMSENQAVYQLESIRRKYDLSADDAKVEFLKEAAELVASMGSSVEREVYSNRAAEMAGVAPDSMRLEVSRAYKRRINAQKKREERQNLRPAEQLQPTVSGLKYENVKSAVAEEGVLGQIFLEPALLDLTKNLTPQQFSSPLLGKVYAWMQQRWQEGEGISIPAMGGSFTPEEISHITRISQKMEGVVSEKALRDYIGVIQSEAAKRSGEDLMAALHRRREQNGYGG
ncbi:MAG: DNA primase [Oscillospiraceae bacterium]|nr:DNA primase [Oscillospiraceae bacterium]